MRINPEDIPEVSMPFMQATHMEEVAILNELYDLFDQAKAGEIGSGMAEKIETMIEHTHAHFAREEERMLALNFPPYPVHKQAHDEYLRALDSVVSEWRTDGNLKPVEDFFKQVTPGWMNQHISTMDFVTANFFRQSVG